MDNMEMPREPVFYKNNNENIEVRVREDTLQSIDNTLKRIEKLLSQGKNQCGALDDSAL